MITATSHACMYAIHEDTGKISHDVYGYHVNKALRIACFSCPRLRTPHARLNVILSPTGDVKLICIAAINVALYNLYLDLPYKMVYSMREKEKEKLKKENF